MYNSIKCVECDCQAYVDNTSDANREGVCIECYQPEGLSFYKCKQCDLLSITEMYSPEYYSGLCTQCHGEII